MSAMRDAPLVLPSRFEVASVLGEGASGVVYAVTDVKSGMQLALKALRRDDRMDIVAFKREFRFFRSLHHPNLVRLEELFEHGGRFFFTMELIPGEDLLAHLGAELTWSKARDARVRDAFRQVAEAVSFVHGARKVHRDIKPSNVRVGHDGRVVLLDFGIAADLDRMDRSGMVGTPEYMSPEQTLDEPITPATDWYAVGAMLHAALTGAPPFTGTTHAVLERKITEKVTFPRGNSPEVPEDLASLCEELIRLEPCERPTGAAVLAVLTGHARRPRLAVDALVGRERELERLRAGLAACEAGGARALLVEGASGLGKTALATRFLKTATDAGETLLLRAACHESESVPYKGLDPILDDLATLLESEDPRVACVRGMVALDVLGQVFPALRNARGPASTEVMAERARGREQLLQAFTNVISTLASRGTLILFLDDMQWIDSDSLEAFVRLFATPGPMQLFLLATRRPRPSETPEWPIPFEVLTLGELSADAAATVARAMGCEPGRIAAVLHQAQGHPFFLRALVRAQEEDGEEVESLDDLVRARVRRLHPSAQRLLERIAVAELPTGIDALAEACDLSLPQARRALDDLERASLARTIGERERPDVLPYHDRVREPVVASLPADALAEAHLRLGRALEGRGADAERLLRHYLGAGETERALASALRAAERASHAFAYGKAVTLYETAMRLAGPGESSARTALLPHLGDALSGARRGGEAARCFIEASSSASSDRRIELERRAGEELTHAGLFDEGMVYLRRVTDALDAPISPRPLQSMLVGLLFRVRWFVLFLLRDYPRAKLAHRDASDRNISRAEAYWTVSAALSHVDTVAASEFSARQLLLCLQIGEPYLLSRAIGLEAAFLGTLGGPFLTFARHTLRVARALVTTPPRRDALAWLDMVDAFLLFFAGDFATSMQRFDSLRAASLEGGLMDQRMYDLSILWQSIALLHRGELTELGPRLEGWHRDAEERRDVSLSAMLNGGETNTYYLLTAGPAAAWDRLERARPYWLTGSFTMHHLMGLLAEIAIHLYERHSAEALRASESLLAEYRRSMLYPLIAYARARALYLLGCSLVAYGLEMQSERHLRRALSLSRKLSRLRLPYAHVAGALVRGAAYTALQRPREAREAFKDAETQARAHGLRLHEAVAIMRGAEGDGASDEGARRMFEQEGVTDARSAANIFSPARRS